MGDLLRHLFTPHHTNNHRAKVLHIDSLLAYVLLFALLNLGIRTLHRAVPDVLGYATDINVQRLLDDTNAKRTQLGLSTLVLNDTLSRAAAAKAADMFANNYWAHTSPQGKTPWSFITGAGYSYIIAGENLAKNFSTSDGVVEAWMNSPTHRDNIVKPTYREIGFAVANGVLDGEETTLVVQMFGTTASAPAPTSKPVEVEAPEVAPANAEAKPAPVPESRPAGQEVLSQQRTVLRADTSVREKPAIDIPAVTRSISFAFILIIIGILMLDGYMVSRKQLVRIAGHNVAHILFFSTLFIALMAIKQGLLV